jgi:hypothetical protein
MYCLWIHVEGEKKKNMKVGIPGPYMKFPTAMYLHNSQRTVEGGAFLPVCNEVIYIEPMN